MDKNREALIAFYRKALTVNTETTPAQVLAEVLADNFVSNGSVESKTKDQLIGQIMDTLLSPVNAIAGGLTNEDLEFRKATN